MPWQTGRPTIGGTPGALIERGAIEADACSRPLRLLRHQLELIGHSAKFGKRTGVHLPHRPAAVDPHRSFGNADIAGDLFAQATLRDLNHVFALPGAERAKTLPEVGQSILIL